MAKPKKFSQPTDKATKAEATGPGSDQSQLDVRRWVFRFVAAVVLPLALLAALEAGLRLAGFGYSTSFFVEKDVKGRRVLAQNDAFGLRFFPAELARSPSPLVMERDKPKEMCRIFILGESAALGDPEPAFGFGRYLQVLLQQRFPQQRFEVICTAMTAINSHVILPIARECSHHQGDVWVIYMGNNEFVGPFGPSTVFGPQVPPLSVIRAGLALKKTRVGQLLSRLASKHSEHDQKSWTGMKMFLDHQVGPADPRKAKVYAYFRDNLEAILAAARAAGAKVVLSTVASNLKDCAPFASEHSKALTGDQKERWQGLFESGIHAQQTENPEVATSNYEAATQIDGSYAELQFRLGQSLLDRQNGDEAKRHFALARDYDTLPFRTDETLNALIRESAKEHSGEGIRLVDSVALLAGQSPVGIPGRESIYEHVHLNFEGNYQVARAVAENVAGLLPTLGQDGASHAWASFEECARRLALTDWDRRRVYEDLLRRLAEPPFVNQINHSNEVAYLRLRLAETRARQTPEALQQARKIYQAATGAAPDDLYLRADFAKLDEDTGDLPGAIEQWSEVRDRIPFAPGPHYYLSRVLGRQGKPEQALQEVDRALALRPNFPDGLAEKGRLLLKADQFEAGMTALDEAARLDPGNPRIYLDRGEALAAKGRRAEAQQQFRAAARLQPASWEAHYLLGIELALSGDIRSAAEQFLETVRLNPAYALGHLNLGIALAKMERLDEAMGQFQETLRLDPSNQKAVDYLHALETMREHKKNANQTKPGPIHERGRDVSSPGP